MVSFAPNRIAVIGATGPTGIHLTRELASRGRSVVAVSRRRDHLEELFARDGIEIATADALDLEATRRATMGCDAIVDCIGLPPERMSDHPKTATVIARAAQDAGARALQISSYWSFLPHRKRVVNEDHPRIGGHEWFRLRREAEDVLLAAGAAVVHLPDFFGPHVHASTVQNALHEASGGKPVHWLGRADTPREVAFVTDAIRIVADLLEREEAYGTDWALPGSGELTGDRFAQIASEHLERPVRLRAVSGTTLRLLALVHPALRRVRPLIPHYARPVRYDSSKLRRLLAEVETTPFERAIPRTLNWIGQR